MPASSQKSHMPTKSSRHVGDTSAICADTKNSGLMVLIRAIAYAFPLARGPLDSRIASRRLSHHSLRHIWSSVVFRMAAAEDS